MADKSKICFIICSNDELQLQECMLYLNLLHVPEGYQTDVVVVTEAVSMTAGYNEAMQMSNAKYKIYLHQDTFIVEPLFLDHLLKIFCKDRKIGMIGMIGAEKLSKDGVMWHEPRCGGFYRLEEMIKSGLDKDNLVRIKRGHKEVEVIDGFLMATQYDLMWREDIFRGFDFYDVSQCMEFRRAGYKIVVPAQKTDWVIHACGVPSFWNYNAERKALLKEYPEIADSKKSRKRILFLHSRQIRLIGLPYTLTQLGHNVCIPPNTEVTLEDGGIVNPGEQEAVEELLEEGHYDLAVTYDFCQAVSNACQNFGVPYYAWVYDSPFIGLYSKEALNEVNYISVFDKKQYERLSLLNLKHLFYLPLAPEIDNFGAVHIGRRDEKKYSCDVSFVGRLYNNRGFEEIFDEKDKAFLEEAERVIRQMNCTWDETTTIFGKASEELISFMSSKLNKDTRGGIIDKRYYCESMRLVRKCNEIERIQILEALQNKFSIVLYADETAKQVLKDIDVRPWLDYGSAMPKVFYLSKINLNITSRSIESGIPQRVWDIMSVGGFCLTNYQPELEEYFEIGRELEVYHNIKELEEKIAYYLEHEEERIRIAINGYKKVRKGHSLKMRLQKALDSIFEDSD